MKIAKVFCIVLVFTSISVANVFASDIAHSYSRDLIANTKAKIESDPDYAAQYFSSALKLFRAEMESKTALQNLNNQTTAIENKMRTLMASAGKLSDGTLVFQSKINPANYFAIDGRPIDADQAKNLGNLASWEEYYGLYQQRKERQNSKAEIIKYQDETLRKSRAKIIDPDLLGLSKNLQAQWAGMKQTN